MIDSHAHYTHGKFNDEFSYLLIKDDEYSSALSTREELLQILWNSGIDASIEPGIDLRSNELSLSLHQRYPEHIFAAVGLHPTRCPAERWNSRTQLSSLATAPGVVAIGETGLDYHHPRKEQHRFRQFRWFLYQINLADRLQLPLILHIRMADDDALKILKLLHRKLHGGVVHCFTGGWKLAQEYLELGYHLGIGGSLLQKEKRAANLWEAVRQAPLERLLLETDSPFVAPDCNGTISRKTVSRTCNTSLILPAVARKIAELKGLTTEEVINTVTENTSRLFALPL